MAQTRAGAQKSAAKAVCLTVEEYIFRVNSGNKRCFRCKTWKARDEFNIDRSRGDGLNATCRLCAEAPSRTGPSRRERRLRLAAGESWCAGCRAWLPATDVRLGKCRAHRREYERVRYANDAAYRHERKDKNERRLRGVARVPPEGIEVLAERYGGLCVYCGNPADTIDHMNPVSLGGDTTPGNVVTACKSCNSRKRAKPLDKWIDEVEERFGISDALVLAIEHMESSFYG